jgi:hypothetical protein
MKRGNIRTVKKYVTDKDGNKKIKYEIQGRRKGVWIPVVEKSKLKTDVPMIYDTKEEAENKLMEIVKKIKGK